MVLSVLFAEFCNINNLNIIIVIIDLFLLLMFLVLTNYFGVELVVQVIC